MVRRLFFLFAALIVFALPASAQEGLNLPADLYVLLNSGQIQRYGMGAAGVESLTPADLYIIDFGVDSVGERVAFRTESGLYVLDIGNEGTPVQLEGTNADVPAYRGSGETMAWSPNGDAIAYTTTYGARVFFNTGTDTPAFVELREGIFKGLSWSPGGRFLAAEAEQNVWWVYRRDGYNLLLTSVIPSSVGTAWISDSELIFAPETGSLRLMNLDQANAQAVLLDESVIYRLPDLNAEDALVFFGRDPNDAEVPDGYGRLLQLQRGAAQLQTIGEVPIALNGLRWTPGGSLLAAFQAGVIALYDPSTGLGFPLPITDAVAYAWGPYGVSAVETSAATENATVPEANPAATLAPTDASAPNVLPELTTPEPTSAAAPTAAPVSTVTALTLAWDNFFLAPDPADGVVQVWKMPAEGLPPQPFTLSGTDVTEFAPSPDGNSVVYVVDAELWLQQVGQQPQLLASLNSFALVEADFSMDNSSLVYADERSGVWINILAEDAPEVLVANDNGFIYRRPQFSPDGTRVLVDATSNEGTAIGVLEIATRNLLTSPVMPPQDVLANRTAWLRDGRIYSYVDAASPDARARGIYLFEAPGALEATTPAIPLPENATVRSSVEAVTGTLRMLLAEGSGALAPLRVVDYALDGSGERTILDIGSLVAPRLSPDGRFVAGYDSLTQIDGTLQGAIVIVDLQSGSRFLLSNPPAAWGFRWAAP